MTTFGYAWNVTPLYHVTVTLSPGQSVVIPTTPQASYICHFINNNGNIQQYQWLVNETQLEDLDLGDRVQVDESRSTRILSFMNISVEYNDTTIQCIVTLTSGEIIRSNNATLLVQGKDKLVAFCILHTLVPQSKKKPSKKMPPSLRTSF